MKHTKEYYRQRLPHIQPLGAAFFITFQLFGTVPKTEIIKLKQKYIHQLQNQLTIKDPKLRNHKIYQLRQNYFLAQEKLMESIKAGPKYLKIPEVASMVVNEIHKLDKELYELVCFTIMSTHVHLVIDTALTLESEEEMDKIFESYKPLNVIMKRIKGPTAIKANRIIKRKGQFWDRESFDIYIRNEKMLSNVINYTLNNPVAAGLVQDWREWPYSYLASSYS